MALDNAAGVFKNVNLRRAAWANLDRAAIIKLRGGSAHRLEPATHFIYPGVDGYDQAGGAAGPQVPWNKSVTGNLQVAEQYMKAAGYKSGKYTGSATVQIVGANNGNDPAIIQLLNTDLTAAGLPYPREPGGPVGHVRQVLRRAQAGDRRVPDRRLGP